MSLPKPYYSHGGITIYHGDCRELLPYLTADVVVTDPPYGLMWGGGRSGWGWFKSVDSPWADAPVDDAVQALLPVAGKHIIFGGNYYNLPPARCWLVWDKRNGKSDFADCELAWTDLDSAVRMLSLSWSKEDRQHPTQKPTALMRWCLGFVPCGVILDPFMGSGTTLVAAKQLGRQAIGIEIEERYCEIAVKRLAQEVLPLEPVQSEPEQAGLL